MQRDGWHGVHVWLCNVLDHHGDIIVPCADRLVIRGCHEPPVLVYEGDRVDRAQMLIILLCDLSRVHIVLKTRVNMSSKWTLRHIPG